MNHWENSYHPEDGRTSRIDGVSRAHSLGHWGHQRLVGARTQRRFGCYWGLAGAGEKQDTPASLFMPSVSFLPWQKTLESS